MQQAPQAAGRRSRGQFHSAAAAKAAGRKPQPWWLASTAWHDYITGYALMFGSDSECILIVFMHGCIRYVFGKAQLNIGAETPLEQPNCNPNLDVN